MKRTEITYTKTMDGKIMIKDIKNAASFSRIGKEFGEEIRRVYESYRPHYHLETMYNDKCVSIKNNGHYILKSGTITTMGDFNRCIKGMKAAGNRLQKIKEAIESYKEKTITI